MLIIRNAQMDALSRHRIANFKIRLGALLAGSAPGMADHERELAVARTMDDARRFGLVSEADIARFGALTLQALGRYPEAGLPVPALAILMSHGLAPVAKLDRYQAWAGAQAQGKRGADV